MHLFLINFPPKIEGHDSFCQFSHMYSCLDLGRTHNLLRTCFLSSCHRGHQPPNQGQPEVFVSSNFKGQSQRELLTRGGPSNP